MLRSATACFFASGLIGFSIGQFAIDTKPNGPTQSVRIKTGPEVASNASQSALFYPEHTSGSADSNEQYESVIKNLIQNKEATRGAYLLLRNAGESLSHLDASDVILIAKNFPISDQAPFLRGYIEEQHRQDNFQAIAAYIDGVEGLIFTSQLANAVGKRWAKYAPEKAIAWADKNSNDTIRQSHINTGIGTTLAYDSPEAVFEWGLDEARARYRLTKAALDAWMAIDPHRAFEKASDPQNPDRHLLSSQAFESALSYAPSHAVEYAFASPNREPLQKIALENWILEDPASAYEAIRNWDASRTPEQPNQQAMILLAETISNQHSLSDSLNSPTAQ